MKTCDKCNLEKDMSQFYPATPKKDGSLRYKSSCKACVLQYNKNLYNTNPAYKEKRLARGRKQRESDDYIALNRERGEKFYYSIAGRAKTLLKGAQRRSSKYGDFNLDLKFVEDKLNKGCCEVTGIKFDYNKPVASFNNKFAPSIDRIDSTKGYTKDNTRIVIWQYNLMKGEILDFELLEICKIIVEKSK